MYKKLFGSFKELNTGFNMLPPRLTFKGFYARIKGVCGTITYDVKVHKNRDVFLINLLYAVHNKFASLHPIVSLCDIDYIKGKMDEEIGSEQLNQIDVDDSAGGSIEACYTLHKVLYDITANDFSRVALFINKKLLTRFFIDHLHKPRPPFYTMLSLWAHFNACLLKDTPKQ